MKKKFTFLIAAIAMMAILVPMKGWGQTTVTQTSFTELSGNVNNDTKVSYAAYKGGGTSNPAVNSGAIRLYQNSSSQTGGYVVIGVASGYQITSATIQSTMATNTGYKLTDTDPGSTTPAKNTFNVSDYSLSANTDYTVSGISTQYITFACFGTTSSSRLYLSKISVTYQSTGGSTPTTYTVTYDCNGGTSGCPENVTGITAGASITLAAAPTKTDYTFDGWNDGTTTYDAGDSYTVNGNVTMTAQWTANGGGGTQTLTFDVSSNPGGWPTTYETTLTNYTYSLYNVNYTFALKNVKCNSGYLMMTQVAVLGLPAIEGYKLTKVVANNSSGCSTSTKVGISSSASEGSYIDGGAVQTWSTTGSSYTYNLTTTEANTMYYMYVTNKNAQLLSIALTYEAATAPTVAAPTFSPADGTTFGNEGLAVTISQADNKEIRYTIDGSTPTASSTLYEHPIVLTTTATIKAIAVDGSNTSSVTTATYTYIDPNAPGTENNPYTVAQARAAIDAGTGTQGVYATGIVSSIPYSYTTNNGITFNMVDNNGDSEFLQAYKCVGTDAPNVTVGDVVVVYGNLTKYSTTYEFGQGCQLVSLTHPAVTVEAPTFSPAAGTYADAQSVTIACETSGATIYYTIDGTVPTSASAQYSSAIAVNTTTTIKAIAIKGSDESTIATATYHINSAANPYTVTQALDFLEYPANGIYVHGIVSTAPSLDPTTNGELTYYISVDGQDTNELEVYKGKGLNEAAFTAQTDLQVGDIVTIYGNVKIYNNIKEFESGNYLVAFERPAVTTPSITLSNNTIDAPAAGADGTLTVTYNNITTVAADVAFYESDGTTSATYDWIDAEINNTTNNVKYLIDANTGAARSAYFKVWAYDDEMNEVYSELVTITQAAYVVDYATLPFEFDGGKADIDNTVGLTQNGIDNSDYSSSPKLKFKTEGCYLILKINETPGELTFDIKGNGMSGTYAFSVMTSTDGITYETNTSYTSISGSTESKTINNLASDVRYIKWVYTTKDQGNVGLGNIKLAAPSTAPVITVTPTTVNNVAAAGGSGTLALDYANLTITQADDFGIQFYDENDQELNDTDVDWILVAIEDGTTSEYEVSYVVDENTGAERTAYFKVYAMGSTDFVYSELVTITQEAYVAPVVTTTCTYQLATSVTSGKHYIIVGENNGDYYAMGKQNSNNRAAVGITMNNTTATATATLSSDDVHEFTISFEETTGSNDYYTIFDEGYLYAASSGSNHLKTESAVSDNSKWNITFSDNKASIVADQSTNRNVMQYNSGSDLFSCYASASQKPVYLYERVYTKAIEAYASTNDKYYLIASPVNDVNPVDADMISDDLGTNVDATTSTYDLYYFNQEAQGAEWVNYRNTSFTLESGKGYLYASKNGTTIAITGVPYNGNGEVTLTKVDGKTFSGWNLIGNPFAQTASLTNASNQAQSYYRMNDDGTELTTGTGTIAAMEGVFVQATSNEEVVTFTPTSAVNSGSNNNNNVNSLNVNVSHEVATRGQSNVIDRAIVRFDEGNTLEKFMLNPENTKLYIPQDGKDYAVVNAQAQGEMPVSFKAAEDGTYTISVETENVQAQYLHLIDNMTGNNIDLLQTPSYSFDAKTTDYATRFRLVFNANNVDSTDDSETFAFISDGNIVICGASAGATVEIIDMMGRVITSSDAMQRISTNGMSAGVYVIRLVQNEGAKTQKIVVK